MLDPKTRFTGLPNVTYTDNERQKRTMLNASWERAPTDFQKTLYDLSIELLDVFCVRRGKNLSSPQALAEEARITANAHGKLCNHVIKHYDGWRSEDIEAVRPTLEAMMAPVEASEPLYQGKHAAELKPLKEFRKLIYETMLATRPDFMQDFFACMHKFGLADELAEQLRKHDFSMDVGRAYRGWLKRNPQAEKTDALKFAVEHQGAAPVRDSRALHEFEVVANLSAVREESKALAAKATHPAQRELHSRIVDVMDFCEHYVSVSFSRRVEDDRNRGIAERISRVVAFSIRHYHDFSEGDRAQAVEMLGMLLQVPQPTKSEQSKMDMNSYVITYMMQQKKIMEHMSRDVYPDFFKSVHMYDYAPRFRERLKARVIPARMSKAYEGWLAENQDWVDRKAWTVPPAPKTLPTVTAVTVPVAAPKPVIVDVPVPVPVTVVREEAVTAAPVAPAPVAPAEPELPTSLRKKFLKEQRRAAGGSGWDFSTPAPAAPVLVKIAAAPALPNPDEIDLDELERLTAPEVVAPVPEAVVEIAPELAVPVVVKPSTEAIAEGLVDTSLIMPVAHVRLHITSSDEDSRDDHGHKSQKQIAKYRDTHEQDKSHDRTGILLPALAKDDCPNKIVYPYIQPVDRNAEKRERPYNVIDIEFPQNEDGVTERARVFVCNFESAATFIQRDTAEAFDPDDEIDIGVLRDDPKVWMVPFLNDGQWLSDIQERLYTPVADMDIQLKRSHFWANRGAALEETFVEYVIQHGRIPKKDDARVIDFGPLAGQATWAAASAALKRETVGGLGGIKTFRNLLTHLCGKYDGLARFVAPAPVRVQAAELKQSLTQGCEDACVAGWEPGVLQMAFRYGAVGGLESVVPAGKKPECLAEFVALVRSTPRPEQG